MKLLIYEWNAFLQQDLYDICREEGVEFRFFTWRFENKNQDEAFEKWFQQNVETKYFDACISINYWPMLARVCAEKGLKYIAWCYDCPLNVVNIEETLGLQTNYVFLFDFLQYQKYVQQGFGTVYHLPLGINRTRYERMHFKNADSQKYRADISFVGSLYESKYRALLEPLDDYLKGYLSGLLQAQTKVYGYYVLDDLLTMDLVDKIAEQYREKKVYEGLELSIKALSFAMASEITRNDRLVLLSLLGRRHDVAFYSYQDCEILQNVRKCAGVDYRTEMPCVFHFSDINLNPSLRIIQTGIPLRAFDVMGAGGFLLSNYQQELAEQFIDGEDVVLYEDYEDAVAKADFYLKHENLRRKIAESGRGKVMDQHTLQQRLMQIFQVTG